MYRQGTSRLCRRIPTFKRNVTPSKTRIKEKDNHETYFQLTKPIPATYNEHEWLKTLTRIIKNNPLKTIKIGICDDLITEFGRVNISMMLTFLSTKIDDRNIVFDRSKSE